MCPFANVVIWLAVIGRTGATRQATTKVQLAHESHALLYGLHSLAQWVAETGTCVGLCKDVAQDELLECCSFRCAEGEWHHVSQQ